MGRARRMVARDRKRALFIWAIGSALFANVVAFFGISYFDQTIVAWYGLLAIISTVFVVAKRDSARESKPDSSRAKILAEHADLVAQLPVAGSEDGEFVEQTAGRFHRVPDTASI